MEEKIKKRHRGYLPSGALLAFLHERCIYVLGSLLSGARYPNAMAKLQTIEDISKFFRKNLRKSYVNIEKERAPAGARCA